MENYQSNTDFSRLSLAELINQLDHSFIENRRPDLYHVILFMIEKPLIEKVLEKTFGNQIKASKLLGINRNTLRTKIRKLGIEVGKWKL